MRCFACTFTIASSSVMRIRRARRQRRRKICKEEEDGRVQQDIGFVFKYIACQQHDDLRLLGHLSDQSAGGGARTRDRWESLHNSGWVPYPLCQQSLAQILLS
ncbi:hypothetical protein PoB_007427800 [Plakobranchus ocellatus]|uniref:Uncharacterized protein n=1 Tax=Plakobranchus ocellatus TaxID=259542 RepID=A0AAV4DTV1_9GAST|nr:hypothetical protein PoB_007427800 [Plakobranchus ocellatus]